MSVYGMTQSAAIIGVSDDTLRRWADQGVVSTTETPGGARGIEGRDLAALAAQRAGLTPDRHSTDQATTSARNRLPGIVSAVTRDTVMAQVELVCGPYRVVSLMSREAADDLGLEAGVLADAVVKATTVVVETTSGRTA
ncbi:MAG: TOBE domain-containing protein [Nocardioidaceae bacterium]|nr:TOBE domain-containing protein [Nocardioidaceae bacterium]